MTVYMVFEPPPVHSRSKNGAASRAYDATALARAEGAAFVPDRFVWSAFLFAPLWMLWHRLWIVLVGYVAASVALALALKYADAPANARGFALLLLALLVGFEAASLRRWTLVLNGWREVGTVVGDDRESAERRFFDRYVSLETTREMEAALASPVPPPPPVPQRDGTDVVGLFPQPGGSG
ncbi:MAG TPA: DUF2628 domain-containing protein [Xanthobacteraceae bacterium]|nr:DUF2628 domain-containing protein [Xanthobacteraceae bacterium]